MDEIIGNEPKRIAMLTIYILVFVLKEWPWYKAGKLPVKGNLRDRYFTIYQL
jgi:hypothetical protein